MLTIRNEETGLLEPCALHFTGSQSLDEFTKSFNAAGMPAVEVARRDGSLPCSLRVTGWAGILQLRLLPDSLAAWHTFGAFFKSKFLF